MADGKELKPKSFRIDEETAEKFKEISNAIGGSQQETLSKLIEAYEFQSGKVILAERKADIEKFENYITAVTRMFMSSLEDNMNMSDTIRSEFEALLKSKDNIIQDLQEKNTVATQLKEQATAQAQRFSEENSKLNSIIEKLTEEYKTKMVNMQSMLSDKDELNKALTDSCNTLKENLDKMEPEIEQFTSLRKEVEQLRMDFKKLSDEKDRIEQQMRQEHVTHQNQIKKDKEAYNIEIAALKQHETDALKLQKGQTDLALEKALLEQEKKHQEQLQEIVARMNREIDQYQSKYLELLEQRESSKLKSNSDGSIERYEVPIHERSSDIKK